MLVSLDWIKDFVEVPRSVSGREFAKLITMSVCEVEEVTEVNGFWKTILVAEITKIEPHPRADKLQLVTANLGEGESVKVVCGASNVRLRLKTPFAKVGTTLPIGFTLEARKIRGVLSEGMLCSGEELGLEEKSDGIMELPEDAPVGTSMLSYLEKKEDTLFNIDNKSLTHRPDLWGHYGMALEGAAVLKRSLKNPFDLAWFEKTESRFNSKSPPIAVSMETESAGLSYFGLSIDGIVVGESPSWMKERLRKVGLRPINSVVDISNYVMLELGIPNHIFDRDTIQGKKLTIKALKTHETFVTLDSIERKLEAGDTVICDADGPLVLAGIMGGKNAGVREETKNIFIEVANWKASLIRKTSVRLGLRTESSGRFEKSLDSTQCKRTLYRIVELILQLNPKAHIVGNPQYAGENLENIRPLVLDIRPGTIKKILGADITKSGIVDILRRLDFKVKEEQDILKVTVPTQRATKDIECEADIVEEIGRHYRYDHITPVSPKLSVLPTSLTSEQQMIRKLRTFLVYRTGAYEVMSYPMIGEKLLAKTDWSLEGHLKLANPLSTDQALMRNSLIPSLLEMAGKNTKNLSNFRFFEYGRSYLPGGKFAQERYQLGILFAHKEQTPFMDILNQMLELIKACKIPGEVIPRHSKYKNEMVPEDWSGLHPYEFKNVRIQGKLKGAVFSVHPILLRKLKIKEHISLAVIDLTDFHHRFRDHKFVYCPLPKFPGAVFDYTVTLAEKDSVGPLFEYLSKVKIKEIVGHKIVDIYKEGAFQHVTMRTTFLDPEKTPSGEFLKQAEEIIVQKLSENGIPLKSG